MDFYKKKIIDEIKKIGEKEKYTIKYLKIILVGKAGVGKTTLIYSLLQLNYENIRKLDFIEYKNEKIIPFLKLIETNIMENFPILNIQICRYKINKILFNENNNDNFIPCIWFCKTGSRNEHLELDFLDSIINDYYKQKIPIILVYTQAIIQDLINGQRNFFQKTRKELEFVNILSRRVKLPNGTYIESYGLHELLKKNIR